MVKITWTLSAREDIKSVYDYIARDSVYYARRFTGKIRYRVEVLGQYPELGRVVPEFGRPEIREIIEGNYRVIYQLSDGKIEIIRVHHSAKLLK